MDTDSLYLALGKQSLEECIRPEKKAEWDRIRAGDCIDNYQADSSANFLPRTCCLPHIKHDKRTPGLFKEEFRGSHMIALCSKTYICYDAATDTTKFSCKGLNKNHLEEPRAKFPRVLEEKTNITSTNRGFRFMGNAMHTYEQVKKGLAYFYPKRKVADDGVHTTPLII